MPVTVKGPPTLPSMRFDRTGGYPRSIGSASALIPITPSDTVSLAQKVRGIYVGVSGNVSIVDSQGNTQVLTNVPVGLLDIRASRVNSTGTTASGLVGLI